MSRASREAVKWCVRAVANVFIFPVLLIHWLKVPLIGRDRALEGSSELLSLIPGLTGQYLRRAFLGWTIEFCHPSASIGFGTVFSKAGARVDENAYIGGHCHIGLVHVERDVLIASGVHITSGARMHGTEDLSKPIKEQQGVNTLVTIGAGAWIGSCAVVMADVGRDSIIGAGAVVTKPIPERVVAAGVPARVIRSRDEKLEEAETDRTVSG
jgi:acetyltransferase-like isoleucine patch superfamily enzyme